jgi:predicted secreted Zn-dependent protease
MNCVKLNFEMKIQHVKRTDRCRVEQGTMNELHKVETGTWKVGTAAKPLEVD